MHIMVNNEWTWGSRIIWRLAWTWLTTTGLIGFLLFATRRVRWISKTQLLIAGLVRLAAVRVTAVGLAGKTTGRTRLDLPTGLFAKRAAFATAGLVARVAGVRQTVTGMWIGWLRAVFSGAVFALGVRLRSWPQRHSV
jgi:hypothetical protein